MYVYMVNLGFIVLLRVENHMEQNLLDIGIIWRICWDMWNHSEIVCPFEGWLLSQ